MSSSLSALLAGFKYPDPDSHKNQNGKLLIIGGSDLFHSASKWSLDVASKFVDMVFYSSVEENNKLIKEVKKNFWNGIVIKREDIESYIKEADVILIGPGMTRTNIIKSIFTGNRDKRKKFLDPARKITADQIDWQNDTYGITNFLLQKYPDKKWVIDAGALQMVEPSLLNSNMIITPHHRELSRVVNKTDLDDRSKNLIKKGQDLGQHKPSLLKVWKKLNKPTIVLKGKVDLIIDDSRVVSIKGGNAGMTKGGTGDVLAGMIAAFYCTNNATTSAKLGSYFNKLAGDELYKKSGPFFNSSDLVEIIPQVVWRETQLAK